MNLPNWIRLKEWLEKQPDEKWDMGSFCGSACCLAGHACLMDGVLVELVFLNPAEYDSRKATAIKAAAKSILGIDYQKTYHVFHGYWMGSEAGFTRQDAIDYLNLAIAAQDPMVTL